ncbi:uncharacterized protein LOC123542965 [Mercenaria mercenaria]|uniref:uncharacterized protein LOC123542965 n=1 Tax=Mercenaria mercenaria TaxID=6596 RepID=UPI00234EEFDA|nr:uncharacterized protein LOC123542965 [Mercenaria mercenaria]
MGGRNSAIADHAAYMKRNLNEIKFNITEEEAQFIQSGIETLVTGIIDHICDSSKAKLKKLKKELVVDVERNSRFGRRDLEGIKLTEQTEFERLIKVGSFYEVTKNHFPDEFDYVFVIGTFCVINRCAVHFFQTGFDRWLTEGYGYDLLDIFTGITFLDQRIYQSDDSLRKLHFMKIKEEESGPARKVLFLYENINEHKQIISVDIVPAFKIYDPFLTKDILGYIRTCSVPKFNRFISETGSYIIVNRGKISFTETEKGFIKNVLSPDHRIVYRLVKHLINGKDKSEMFKEYCIVNGVRNLDISSFTIKTTIIAHHFRCVYGTQERTREYIHICARDILLDLKEQVTLAHRRNILSDIEARNNKLYDRYYSDSNFIRVNKPSKYKLLRRVGTKYLSVLGESLNPSPGTSLRYMFKDIDKSYSQYMLDKSERFFW